MANFALSEQEQAVLVYVRDNGEPSHSRGAQVILLSAEGMTISNISEILQLSDSQTQRWRRGWKNLHLDLFPESKDCVGTASNVVECPELTLDSVETASSSFEVDGGSPEMMTEMSAPRLPLELRQTVGLLPEDPMAEAGRKVLLFDLEQMLLHESGSHQEEDIEAVHSMHVATHRMRSAIRLFRSYFKPRTIKPFSQEVCELAGLLGDVRDIDVLIEKARRYSDTHSETNLDPLIVRMEKRRGKACTALIRHLDSKSFGRFVERFHEFLTTSGKGARTLPSPDEAAAFQVRHLVPCLIYTRFEHIRAYETRLDDAPRSTLHAIRSDFKRFRYALEFFEEILGSEIQHVIKETKIMQEHLDDLNDTQVAGDILQALIDKHNARHSGVPVFMRPDMTGVLAYTLATHEEQQRLLNTLPAAWANFTSNDVRRDLALAVAAL